MVDLRVHEAPAEGLVEAPVLDGAQQLRERPPITAPRSLECVVHVVGARHPTRSEHVVDHALQAETLTVGRRVDPGHAVVLEGADLLCCDAAALVEVVLLRVVISTFDLVLEQLSVVHVVKVRHLVLAGLIGSLARRLSQSTYIIIKTSKQASNLIIRV